MWGYDKINDTYYLCDKCGAVVGNLDKHKDFHRRNRDETDLVELLFPVRLYNALRKWHVETVEQLIEEIGDDNSTSFFFDLRNIGFKTAEQGTGVLQRAGIVDTSCRVIKD